MKFLSLSLAGWLLFCTQGFADNQCLAPVTEARQKVVKPEQRQDANVLAQPLETCSRAPLTGWFRDGSCRTNAEDQGRHLVCAVMTSTFLEFTKSRGNDLSTPSPRFGFPGLKPGDRWCLCALRWKEALKAGAAPPVVLPATHAKATGYVTLKSLQERAVQDNADQPAPR